jgi:anaerobic ribonucleoside-triphosphate reductase activating protein
VQTVRVGHVVESTEAEGPGKRFALWVQGCSIRCPGCCNPHFFDPSGGSEISVDQVIEHLERVASEIEGVTFLGGEPFEQDDVLAVIARAARASGLSVMTFTGRLLEEVVGSPLTRETDLLVDGPFVASLPETERLWVGSTNQRFHFLTGRYTAGIERGTKRTVELRVTGNTLSVNGWPDLIALRSVLAR